MPKRYSWETTPAKRKAGKTALRGCEHCPLNRPGHNKVIRVDKVIGRKAMVWGIAPGNLEEKVRKELVGPSGNWLWSHMKAAGLNRSDFDIQNVVRCRPTRKIETKYGPKTIDREPTKEESHCCSIFTEQALENNDKKAVIHLVLGNFTAKTLLGKEFRKDRPVFWSEKLQAKVICVAHPAYFLRGGTSTKLEEFKAGLRAIKEAISGKSSRFSYLESQNYKGYTSWKTAEPVLNLVERKGTQGLRLSVDVEYGKVKGKKVLLCVGFSWKSGISKVFYVDHPEKPTNKPSRDKIVKRIREIMENPKIKKSFHHGTSDDNAFLELVGIKTAGYDFDTNYSEYLAYSSNRAFGLAEIAHRRFPVFAGYKDIIAPYIQPDEKGEVNYANIPKRIMTLYNGADCDISKRIELTTGPKIDLKLLKVYKDAAYIIDAMEKRGPLLDLTYYDRLLGIIPKYVKNLLSRLRILANDQDFNPNSVPQVSKILYDDLELPTVTKDKKGEPTRSTGKETLQLLEELTENEFVKVLLEFRRYNRMDSVYLPTYKGSAEKHKGQIRTQWWLTGTITGRLRSGAGKEGRNLGLINMQNLHGAPMLQNLLVANTAWEDIRKEPKWKLERNEHQDLIKVTTHWDAKRMLERFGDTDVFLACDYSQAELRVLAHMSKDKLLIKQFKSGIDIHALVVNALVGWPIEQVLADEEKRRLGKNIHFGVVFGLTEDSLVEYARAKGAKVKASVIKSAYRKYFRTYTGVKKFIEYQRDFGEKNKYVTTMFGFKRELNKQDEDRESFVGNQAVNSPIQGGSHQMLLMAMATLKTKPKTYWALNRVFAEIHDAFYFKVKLRDLPAAYEQSKQLMEVAVPKYVKDHFGIDFSVPLVADAKAGFRMGAMAKYKGQPVHEFVADWVKKNIEVETKVDKELLRIA